MTNIEFKKLQLLSFSQKRVTATKNKSWVELSEMETQWNKAIALAMKELGDDMSDIVPQLLSDMDFVIENLKQAQNTLLDERSNSFNRSQNVKKYLE